MNEIWKDIKGYERLYQVSNFGEIKSYPRNTTKGGLLTKALVTDGYYAVVLYKNGKRKMVRVNRIVAETFIPNPNNYPQVNHKNEFEKTNNRVDNLEWCTAKYNANYGTHKERVGEAQRKKVYQYDLNLNLIKEWDFLNQCIEGGFSPSKVSLCCNKKRNKHKEYVWSYKKNKEGEI